MKIFLFILGLVLIHGLGKEYGIASKDAESIMNFIFAVMTLLFTLLFHWLVANGINRKIAKFFSAAYCRIFPITLVVLVISAIYGWVTTF